MVETQDLKSLVSMQRCTLKARAHLLSRKKFQWWIWLPRHCFHMQVSRLVCRKHNLFRLKGLIPLDMNSEFQTRLISSDSDDTCHNVTSTINSLICHISSGDTDTSKKAMKETEEILRQRNKVEAMSGHINEFLVASFQSIKFINQRQEEDKEWGKEQIIL